MAEASRLDQAKAWGKTTLRRSFRYLRRQSAVGAVRARYSVLPALQMTVAAVAAYLIAEQLLGHYNPIFAAVAALIAMGFAKEPRIRKVIEVSVGCTLGVLLADSLVHFFGSSFVVALVAVFLAVMLARFLDSGSVLAMQMGLQALLVVFVPPPETEVLGTLTRSVDAIVGGLTALAVTLITPKDPRREPIRELRGVTEDVTSSLQDTARALRSSDSREAWHGLIRARSLQKKIDNAYAAISSAKELADFSPAYRRHRKEVRALGTAVAQLDLAARTPRLISRRAISTIDHAAMNDDGTAALAQCFEDIATASAQLSQAVSTSGSGFLDSIASARNGFTAVAVSLHPKRMGIGDLEGEALVALTRTMVIDLLIATGLEQQEAIDYLPRL